MNILQFIVILLYVAPELRSQPSPSPFAPNEPFFALSMILALSELTGRNLMLLMVRAGEKASLV